MRPESHARSSPVGIRIVSTPLPPGRLTRDLGVRLRALYDGILNEPLPDRLLAVAGSLDQHGGPSRQEMSDGPATIARGVGRRR